MPRYQAPIALDWSFWPPSRPVAPWQAVALSLNLDPNSLKHSPDGWMAGPGAPPFFLSESFPDAETETAFKKRSDLLASYRPSLWELLPLQDFATWAVSVNLAPIPPELVAMTSEKTASGGRFPEPAPSAPEQAKSEGQVGNAGTWQEQACQIADECYDHDAAQGKLGTLDVLAKKDRKGEVVGGYAYRVMEIMQERKIHAPRGRITNAATIAKELQGKKWWGNKVK